VTREIEGLALLVMYQLYAQQTGSETLRNDDLLIPSCCLDMNPDFKLSTKELQELNIIILETSKLDLLQ